MPFRFCFCRCYSLLLPLFSLLLLPLFSLLLLPLSKEPPNEPNPPPPPQPRPRRGPAPHLRRLVLTGFVGAGKTTIGRLLAARLNWDFLDLDAYIESRAGLSVPSIFTTHGDATSASSSPPPSPPPSAATTWFSPSAEERPRVLTNRLMLSRPPPPPPSSSTRPLPTLFDRCMMQALGPAPASAESPPRPPAGPTRPRPAPAACLADPPQPPTPSSPASPSTPPRPGLTLDTASLFTPEDISSAALPRPPHLNPPLLAHKSS